ncbi:GNAT family N-acetyltransferase [Emticicia sp. SJ17W-69]|uniref:GNAT family N-acetyltransferase n=1 Tax=Emticicia sp. SJ17W-69 TaxID=3421657 RepID=UPI003EBB0607
MNSTLYEKLLIRRWNESEAVPYDLLLLADDTIIAIDKYLENGELFVTDIEGKIIAAFILKVENKETIEIKNIAVSKEFQGKGIGSILLKYIAENVKNRGFKNLLVGTCDQCFNEIEFYKKSGFEDFKIRKDFFINNYNEPIYEKDKQIFDMIVLKKTF